MFIFSGKHADRLIRIVRWTNKTCVTIIICISLLKLVKERFLVKELEAYFGNLHFEDNVCIRKETYTSFVSTMISGTRSSSQDCNTRTPYYFTALVKFPAMKLTLPKDDSWLQVLFRLAPQREMDMIKRRAATQCEPSKNTTRKICEIMLHDWIKSKAVKDDKALEDCKRYSLLDDCKKFLHIQQNFLSDSNIAHMAKFVGGNWKSVAQNLEIFNAGIEEYKQADAKDNKGEVFELLSRWLLSDLVISSGTNLVADLLQQLESTRQNESFISYIKQIQDRINQP